MNKIETKEDELAKKQLAYLWDNKTLRTWKQVPAHSFYGGDRSE